MKKAILANPYITHSAVASTVGLVIVKAGDRTNAMTVSFFSEAAHHPTSLWVSIARTTYTHRLIDEAGGQFSLIVLHRKQRQIALACGSVSGRDRDKCASLSLYKGPEGFLFLAGALSSTACRVRQSATLDEYTLFIADIIRGEVESRTSHLRPLLLSDF